MTKEDAAWNSALVALGRQWRKNKIHYEPEGLHDINKAVWALWRGPKDDNRPDIEALLHERSVLCACGEYLFDTRVALQPLEGIVHGRSHTPQRCQPPPEAP